MFGDMLILDDTMCRGHGYHVYDKDGLYLTCIGMDSYPEYFLEFSEFRDKKINDILDEE